MVAEYCSTPGEIDQQVIQPRRLLRVTCHKVPSSLSSRASAALTERCAHRAPAPAHLRGQSKT